MLGYRDDVFRAGVGEEFHPGGGIELLRLEHRDEVLVAELRLRPVRLEVVLVGGVARHVHVARIPFVRERGHRSEEHTSELQSLMRISYAVFCLKNKKKQKTMI